MDTVQRPGINEEMFVVEGVLSELHVELGTENLLARIDKHYRGKAVLTGMGAVVGDLFGQAASAASLAMYDGEDTQNFMCLIDGRVMCGQFGGAEWLRNGHRVKAAVEQRDGVLYARGIVDEASGLLWVGYSKGTNAEMRSHWKLAWWLYGFLLVFWNIFYLVFGGVRGGYLETMSYPVIGGAGLCFGMAIWASRDMQALAGPTTEIYQLLGFANSADINLNSYRMSLEADNSYLDEKGLREPKNMVDAMCQVRNVYLYQRAIADGRLVLET